MLARKHKNQHGLSSGGFSLKGTTRNRGYIGQTNHNSIVRTIFKGTEPVGHGGTCGTYKKDVLCNNQSTCSTANPSSTLTTSGYISTRVTNPIVKKVEDKCPTKWVKLFNPLDHAQSNYVKKVKNAASSCVISNTDAGVKEFSEDCNETYYIGTRKMTRSVYSKNADAGAISAGDYTETLLYTNKCLPTPPCKQSFPMIINNTNTCASFYLTPQEAQADGLLPADWMNCKTATAFGANPYK